MPATSPGARPPTKMQAVRPARGKTLQRVTTSVQVRDTLSSLLQRVADWCQKQHLKISPKTKTIVLSPSTNVAHEVREGTLELLPIEVAGLTLNPQSEVRLLGWRLDTMLHGNAHVAALVARGEKFVRRLALVARFIHPQHLRSLWASMVADMLRGAPIWTRGLTAASWTKLETLLAQGCRVVLRAVGTARTADVLAEAGFRPFRHMVDELAVEWAYRFSCDSDAALALPRSEDLLLRRQSGLLPWLPGLQPTLAMDRVSFLYDPPEACSADDPAPVRLASNMKQRKLVSELLGCAATSALIGWCDGSVVHEGGTPQGGGAALLFLGSEPTPHDHV